MGMQMQAIWSPPYCEFGYLYKGLTYMLQAATLLTLTPTQMHVSFLLVLTDYLPNPTPATPVPPFW